MRGYRNRRFVQSEAMFVTSVGLVWSYLTHLSMTTVQASPESYTCPPGTFHNGMDCVRCRRCNYHSVVRRSCTKDKDTECLDCDGDALFQRSECRKCPPCPEGQFVAAPCTDERPTVCRTCPQGSYNPKLSYADVCVPCISCHKQGRKIATPCSSHSDAVCGTCRKGFYFESGSSRCAPCRSCISTSQRQIGKCQKDGRGRNCGRVLNNIYRHSVRTAAVDDKGVYVIDLTNSNLNIKVKDIDETTSTASSTQTTVNNPPKPATSLEWIGVYVVPFCVVTISIVVICLCRHHRAKAAKQSFWNGKKQCPAAGKESEFEITKYSPLSCKPSNRTWGSQGQSQKNLHFNYMIIPSPSSCRKV